MADQILPPTLAAMLQQALAGAPAQPPPGPQQPPLPTLGRPPQPLNIAEFLQAEGVQPPPGPLPGTLMPTDAERADLQREATGLGNAAMLLGPVAMSGPLGAGARGLANLMTAYPRSATAATAGTMLVDQTTAAGPQRKPAQKGPTPRAAPPPRPEPTEAADPQLQRLLESDAVLRRLQAQIDEQNEIANAGAGDYPLSARNGARARAADLQKEYNARLQELTRANLPFDQAYPWLAQNRALVALGGPALAGYGARAGMNLISRIGPNRWERALRQADRALERGNQPAYEHYMARATRFEPRQPGWASRVAHGTTPPLAGGALGAELALLPYQHNVTNAPLGSPQRREAEDMLGDVLRWGPRAALGGGVGAIGGYGAGHMPNISPGFRPPPPGPTPAGPPPPIGGPTPATQLPGQAQAPTALPPQPTPPVGPTPQPTTPMPAATPPALASLGTTRRPTQPAAPEAAPPAPAPAALPALDYRRRTKNPDDPAGHWVAPRPAGTAPVAGETWASPETGRNAVIWNERLRRWQDIDTGAIRSGPGRGYRRIASANDAPGGAGSQTTMAEFLTG